MIKVINQIVLSITDDDKPTNDIKAFVTLDKQFKSTEEVLDFVYDLQNKKLHWSIITYNIDTSEHEYQLELF